jgi:hypothetical protein
LHERADEVLDIRDHPTHVRLEKHRVEGDVPERGGATRTRADFLLREVAVATLAERCLGGASALGHARRLECAGMPGAMVAWAGRRAAAPAPGGRRTTTMSEAHERVETVGGTRAVHAGARRRLGVTAAPWIPYVVAFTVALAAYLVAFDHIRAQEPTGDEPTYVLDAFSMARDGDRDLSNQFSFSNPKPLIRLFGGPDYPHGHRWTSAGYISWHGAGLAFALVPAVWLGDALNDPLLWMRLELVLIDALAALALFALVRRIGSALGIRPVFAWVAWASAALSLPMVAYGDQFYPEIPALLCALVAANLVAVRRPHWWHVAVGSAFASYLPWLHVRFIPVCLGLVAALAARGIGALAPPTARSRPWPTWAEISAAVRAARSRAGLGVLAAAGVPTFASFLFMAYEFDRWYGSPAWTAMTLPGPPVKADAWYFNVLGGLFGTDYGFLPWAPVLVLALASLGCLWLLAPRWTTVSLLIVAGYVYVLGASGIATPGYVLPGRYYLVCVPLLAIPLMVVLSRVKVAWLAFVPLAAVSLAISAQASQHSGYLLINTGTVKLPLAAHLSSAFPDIENPNGQVSFSVDQRTQIRTVGKVIGPRHVAVATRADGHGFVTAGPGVVLAPGTYVASFDVAQRGGMGTRPLVDLQVWSLPGVLMALRPLGTDDLPPGALRHIDVPFATPGGLPVETRAEVYGRAAIRVGNIDVHATSLAASPLSDSHPNAGLMLGWVFGLIFLGALLVALVRAQRPPAPTARA